MTENKYTEKIKIYLLVVRKWFSKNSFVFSCYLNIFFITIIFFYKIILYEVTK